MASVFAGEWVGTCQSHAEARESTRATDLMKVDGWNIVNRRHCWHSAGVVSKRGFPAERKGRLCLSHPSSVSVESVQVVNWNLPALSLKSTYLLTAARCPMLYQDVGLRTKSR